MRELSVYYCDKCGYYAYYQLPKNAVCHKCNEPMTLLSISHQEFTNFDHEARDRFIVMKMIEASPTLAHRITAPEKMYRQRKLVGTLTQCIKEQDKEIKSLTETVEWMHAMIWEDLRKRQALKEEIRRLKESAAPAGQE